SGSDHLRHGVVGLRTRDQTGPLRLGYRPSAPLLEGGRLRVDADRRRIPAAQGRGGGADGPGERDQRTAKGHAILRVHGESYQATASLEKCGRWPVTVWR